MIRDVR